jgi:hypothetical protein
MHKTNLQNKIIKLKIHKKRVQNNKLQRNNKSQSTINYYLRGIMLGTFTHLILCACCDKKKERKYM